MRFQATETVQTSDIERVLDALEHSLRQFSDEVERAGHQITLRGLGPSPRARNYRDTSVFAVVANNGSTIINADVTFQASALLAASGQDTVVRGKLDHAFEQMRARLGLSNGNHYPLEASEAVAPSAAETAFPHHEDFSRFGLQGALARGVGLTEDSDGPPPSQFTDEIEPVSGELRDAGRDFSAGETSAAEPVVETVVAPVVTSLPEPVQGPVEKKGNKVEEGVKRRAEWAQPEVAAPASAEAPVHEEGGTANGSGMRRGAHESSPKAAVEPRVSASRLQPIVRPERSGSDSSARRRAVVDQLRSSSHPPRFSSDEAHKTKLPVLVVGILAVLVAAGSVYLYWAGDLNLAFARRMISTAPDPQTPPPPPITVTPVVQPEPDPQLRHAEADPKVWLDQWADAMRGRDPVLQASFYTDPVANYLGDANVSNDSLTTGFRSAIQARDGIWTLKLEKVSVEKKSANDLMVRLTKHFMQMDDVSAQSTAQINDRYVRSRLELRRIDGEWRIASEQDVTSPNAVATH